MSETDIVALTKLRYTFQADDARSLVVDMTSPDD
jgi:hypothetical protein